MGKRILFVEDDAGFRRVFTHAIREALVDEGLGVASWRLAPWPRHTRGLGRAA